MQKGRQKKYGSQQRFREYNLERTHFTNLSFTSLQNDEESPTQVECLAARNVRS